MAKIYPEHLPERIKNDLNRSAEINVYDAFRTLDDDYCVFYGSSWQQRFPNADVINDGEADFIVAHPSMGVLVFEVKGGGISYDAKTREWCSSDRNGEVHIIKDPVQQARKSRFALLEKLHDLPGWDRNRFIDMGESVIFPDIIVEREDLRFDLPREIIIDRNDLKELKFVIPTIMQYYKSGVEKKGILGGERLALLEKLLAKSFTIKVSLGTEIDLLEQKLITLTERQMELLDFLGTRRRAAIKGCAGSGKTMLAIEKARRLSEEGFNVLMLCYNYPLADYLSNLFTKVSNVDVKTFHKLCVDLAKEAGITLQQKDIFDKSVLPQKALEGAEVLKKRYDAIIVDEGQDFFEEYWIVIDYLIDTTKGILYIFYDDNQNLYSGFPIENVISEQPFKLYENCRNTKAIHEVVRLFYEGKDRISSQSPPGLKPKVFYYSDNNDLKKKLKNLLNELIDHEQISNKDIIILSPPKFSKAILNPGTKLGNRIATEGKVKNLNEIRCTSVNKFKGLESKVVILIENDGYSQASKQRMYIGCSRAISYLILFIDEQMQSIELSQIFDSLRI